MLLSRRSARPLVMLALVAALGACGSSGSAAPGASAPASPAQSTATPSTAAATQRLDATAFEALVTSGSAVLLDVRTPQEYAGGHLKGAQLIDVTAADFGTRLAALDKNATYAVYCRSGNRSGQAVQLMKAAGFSRLADLDGGIVAWAAAGKPVTTS